MCYESTYRFGGHHEGCGFGHPGHHGMREHWQQQQACCCHPGYGMRRFPTREEMIAQMEDYLKQLRAEAKGVEEHIVELRKQEG